MDGLELVVTVIRRPNFLGPSRRLVENDLSRWKYQSSPHHPLSAAIKLGIRYPRKKESKFYPLRPVIKDQSGYSPPKRERKKEKNEESTSHLVQ